MKDESREQLFRGLLIEWWTSDAQLKVPKDLYVRTAHALDYAVCPRCTGTGKDGRPDPENLGCPECDGTGLVSR